MNGAEAAVAGVAYLVIMLAIYAVMIGISVTMYVLNSIGLMKMAKTCGLAHPWMAFIPFASTYLMGKLAEKNPQPGKKSWPWRHIVLIGQIVVCLLVIALYIFVFAQAFGAILNDEAFTEYDLLEMMGGLIGFMAVYMLIAAAYSVAVYIIYWKIYSLFAPENAVLFLVLTIFVNLAPIFFFVIRNRKPVYRADPNGTAWL